jgi:hypothetical protein
MTKINAGMRCSRLHLILDRRWTVSETSSGVTSRRKALAFLGLGALLGLAGSALVTASDAEAQTREWSGAKAGAQPVW